MTVNINICKFQNRSFVMKPYITVHSGLAIAGRVHVHSALARLRSTTGEDDDRALDHLYVALLRVGKVQLSRSCEVALVCFQYGSRPSQVQTFLSRRRLSPLILVSQGQLYNFSLLFQLSCILIYQLW